MTGGLFAALGLGPFFVSGKTQTGWIAFVMKFPLIKQLVTDAAAAIKAAPAVAAAAANVLLEIYRQGLLWKFVKFLLAQLGWWVLFRIVAKIIEVFLIPEAAMVELVASFVVWIAATVYSAVTAYQTCTPSMPAGQVTATP